MEYRDPAFPHLSVKMDPMTNPSELPYPMKVVTSERRREVEELVKTVAKAAGPIQCPAGCPTRMVWIDLSQKNESPTSARLHNGCCDEYHNAVGQALKGLANLLP